MAETGVRRPIAARRWGVSQQATSFLARRGATPNAISVAGMVAGLLAGLCLAATAWAPGAAWLLWLLGALLIQLRLVANMLDGMVAVETGAVSAVGELYNEIPDRVSDTAILVGLGYAAGGDVVLGWAAALAAMATAYVRAVGGGVDAKGEFCGPMAKQQRMALATLVAVYCGIASLLATPWRWAVPLTLAVITVGAVATAIRRLLRIAAKLRSRA
jgi:phosphatidylglycerophosphate synthase